MYTGVWRVSNADATLVLSKTGGPCALLAVETAPQWPAAREACLRRLGTNPTAKTQAAEAAFVARRPLSCGFTRRLTCAHPSIFDRTCGASELAAL